MNIIISGIQGSGKGTQATYIAEKLNLKHICPGDVLRKHINDETEFGLAYKDDYNAGKMAPDEITNDIIKYETDNLDGYDGYILDGFPRNDVQAKWTLDNLDVDFVINLNVPDYIAKNRLAERNRSDDSNEGILKRIAIYETETKPAIEMLGIDLNISGMGAPVVISERIIDYVTTPPKFNIIQYGRELGLMGVLSIPSLWLVVFMLIMTFGY